MSSLLLIQALRQTARHLQLADVSYRWSHFGQCNCGHLAQTLTQLTPETLQRAAERQRGDWSEQATTWERTAALADYGDRPALDEGAWEPEGTDHCTTTDVPMDLVFRRLTAVGLTAEDMVHLERLSDPRVRKRLGTNTVDFHYADRTNLVRYLNAWADVLELDLPRSEAPGLAPMVLPLAAE